MSSNLMKTRNSSVRSLGESLQPKCVTLLCRMENVEVCEEVLKEECSPVSKEECETVYNTKCVPVSDLVCKQVVVVVLLFLQLLVLALV